MASKEKRGLGAGLDVLFGSDGAEEEAELRLVPIARVEPRADQPRQVFDETALQELADSIAQYGLIQPITVRKLDTGYYQIIAGERRWRASRLAGLHEVPVRVIEADDRRAAELALVENLQREDLNPVEEAEGYRTLMETYGLTQEEAARSVGRSRPAVANALRLLSLSSPVLSLVEKGKLSAGHARTLLPLEGDRQLAAAEEILQKELSVRKTEQLVKKWQKLGDEKPAPAPSPLSVDYAAEVSESLSRALGRKVRLVEGGRSRIEIEYYGPDDREALIERLASLSGE